MPLRRAVLALLATGPLPALAGRPAKAAPKARPWPRWEAHEPGSTLRVDHAPWAALLQHLLRPQPDGRRLVAYRDVGPAERAALEAYLAALSATAVSRLSRPEQMAFWINLYNALTLEVVLDHWPVRSIRDIDISPGLFADGPWGARLIAVEGEPLALDDIEHRILRPIWRDPRIHYAVNCASMGCPDLALEPYRADRLDAQLDRAGFEFVNHPRAVRIDRGKLFVSSIYHWFVEDFDGNDRAVVEHLCAYAAPPLAMVLQQYERIDGHAYDWAINAAP
ncbi:MAG: DUF547 domain-containing protein [Geminicoccaceae bacterium]|nr:DUF547 domain-containing protein [Geminicoccaceae bacterium]